MKINETVIDNAFDFVRNGVSIKQTEGASGIPITRIESIWNGEVDSRKFGYANINESNEGKYTDYFLDEGDILMSHINSPKHLGKSAIVEDISKKIIHGMNLLCLRSKKNILYPKFGSYYFKSNKFKNSLIKISNQSVNQASFSAGKLKKLKIPLPPLKTQKKIASILDDAQALKQKTEQLLKEYDELAQSIFLDMFGDPVTNPKGWEIEELKKLTTAIMSGSTPKGGSKVYVPQGITFFRSQNVWRNRIEQDDVAYIDQSTHLQMKKSSLKSKDILMTKTGRVNTEKSSLGRAAIYLGKDDKANINGHVYLIRPKHEVINEFILFILTTVQYRDYIRRVCVGGIDKRQINKDHIEKFPIIYPPTKLQNQFAEKIKLIEQQKKLAKQELKESEDLFQALLQKAFKGELV